MISLKVKGKTLEVMQGSHIYFSSDEGVGFFKTWDEIEAEDLKNAFARLEKMAEAVMERMAQAAAVGKARASGEIVMH
jgi:hypothetical protein